MEIEVKLRNVERTYDELRDNDEKGDNVARVEWNYSNCGNRSRMTKC